MKHSNRHRTVLTADAEQRLRRFEALLVRWNARINLVSRADCDQIWSRHILDCAQLVALLPSPSGTLVDIGSGAGFPGLVLALTTQWRVHLVESDQRKAAFLREAVRVTGTSACVHAVRVQTLQMVPAQVVTARAVAPLATLLGLALPILAASGICLFPKGESVEDELTAAANEWHMQVERFPSQTCPSATLLRISEIRRAGPVI